MMAPRLTQLQQPPGFAIVRKVRQRLPPSRPSSEVLQSGFRSPDPMHQRRGLDGLLHGTTTARIAPAIMGEPRQVTPAIFSSTWPGLNLYFKHFVDTTNSTRSQFIPGPHTSVDEFSPSPKVSLDAALRKRDLRSSSANSTSSSKLSACLTPTANEWESEPSYGYYSGLTPDVLPRRVMRNGQLFFDHRFDPSGQAIKDATGNFNMSPFNATRKMRRTPSEESAMMKAIKLCAELQNIGTKPRAPTVVPQYFTRPLEAAGRFESPARRREKPMPLGISNI